jgi:hypothetical protein
MRIRHEVPGRAAFPDDPAEHLLMPRSRHGIQAAGRDSQS